jgi:hypothetical protein
MLFINGLAKVTNNAVIHGMTPVNVIRIGRNVDYPNWVPFMEQVSVEFDTAHCWHMHICDQACCVGEMRRV